MRFTLESAPVGVGPRAGVVETCHGAIPTPIFMPVGTAATVKAVYHRDLASDVDAKIILANTYHLHLRPGMEVIGQAGGLHRFMGWDRPVLTDSGGFQVFSLTAIRKLREEGVEFRSHIDGSRHFFTPESVVDTQRCIGSDIMMALDECPPGDCDRSYAARSLRLTQGWLERGHRRFLATEPRYGHSQAFFPIVQGAAFADLRREAARHVADLGCEGNAIGGLSVGEPAEVMYEMIEAVNEILPVDRPRYLMGVGTPANLLEGIARGVDMFDCVMPTRNGRNGMLFTRRGVINMRNKKWETDFSPLDPDGGSFVDTHYSRAYVRHLFHTGESLGPMIASLHNLNFYLRLVQEARQHILLGDFEPWRRAALHDITRRL